MLKYIVMEANGIRVPLICWIVTAVVALLPLIGAILTWIERRKYK